MERALFVILALGLNAFAMGPWAMREPLASVLRFPAQIIRAVERRLNRPQRSLIIRRRRGILLMVAALMTALAIGLLVKQPSFRLVAIMLLAFLLPVRPTWDRASAIGKALQSGDIASARLALKDSAWRHYALLDDHALARAAIEMLAVNFSEKILAPALWYIVLGMPGFLINKALYLLKENLCQPMVSGNGFSQPVAMAHLVANYIPARLGALLWLPTMVFLPSGQPFAVVTKQVMKAVTGKAAPEQVSVLAAAAISGLSLGGPMSVYTGSEWLGNGSAKASFSDVTRALYLFALLHLFGTVLLGFRL